MNHTTTSMGKILLSHQLYNYMYISFKKMRRYLYRHRFLDTLCRGNNICRKFQQPFVFTTNYRGNKLMSGMFYSA